MKRKRNIYDADDAAKSKRLHFSAEERAAHAEKKAEILGEKLEKAKADLPKKRRARINREFDAMTGKVRHSLSFEDEVKPRSRKNPVARAGLKAGRTVDLAAHSKIRQVEKENCRHRSGPQDRVCSGKSGGRRDPERLPLCKGCALSQGGTAGGQKRKGNSQCQLPRRHPG